MIRKAFLTWHRSITSLLLEKDIETVKESMSEEDILDPSLTIWHESPVCLGQISVWESNKMWVEAIDLASEKILIQEYFEVNVDSDFSGILSNYFDCMTRSEV